MSKKTRVLWVLLSILVISVVSGKHGGRYNAAKDAAKNEFDNRQPLGGHGSRIRNNDSVVCLMENFVRDFSAVISFDNVS